MRGVTDFEGEKMREMKVFVLLFVLLLCGLCPAHAAKTLAVQSTSTVFTAYSGGTGSAELMLVNCGTETLNYSLEANSSFLEYVPQSGGSWVDISADYNTEELVFTNQVDEVSSAIELPFGFPFYYGVYTRVFIGENGGIALGESREIGPDCEAFPTENAPALFVAPYWGDLEYNVDQSHIYYLAESNRLIVTYDRMRNNDYEGDWQTFQVVLEDSGRISFWYNGAAGFDSVVRGIQNRDTGQELNLWSGGSIRLGPDLYEMDTDAAYDWESGGTVITLHDPSPNPYITVEDSGNSDLIDIGFEFPFYGELYTDFKVSVDGMIILGYTNDIWGDITFPSSTEPYPLIIPFGQSRLEMSNTSSIVYKRESDALIVTYNNIWLRPNPYIGPGGFQTFQAILQKNGNITFQYKDLNGDIESGSHAPAVGVQDGGAGMYEEVAPTDDFALDAAMDQRAIKFSAQDQKWLSVSPAQGSIPPDSFKRVTIQGDSSELASGESHQAQLLVVHDASNYDSPVQHPVTMHVLQNPGAFLSIESVRYEPVSCYRDDRAGPGDTVELYVTLENSGSTDASGVTAELKNATHFSISEKTQDYGDVSAYEEAVNAQPYVVNVSNNCPAGLYNLTLEIDAEPSKEWLDTVQILVQPTPTPAFSPEYLVVSAREGQDKTVSLVVSNSGSGPLMLSVDESLVPTNYVWQTDTNAGVSYDWLSSSYSWTSVELNDPDPNPYITAADAGYSDPVDIGFNFPFWGEDYTQVVVHADGVLTFPPLTNRFLASSWNAASGPLIAAYWPGNTLIADDNASIKWKAYEDRFVISYLDVFDSALIDGPDQTFQVILEKDGTIKYQYQAVSGSGWPSSKVGVKSPDGPYNAATLIRGEDIILVTNQHGYVYTTYPTNIEERVIQFEPGLVDWIDPYSPVLSTLQPQESHTLNFTCTAEKLSAGTYTANLLFTYQEGVVEVPIIFYVSQ